RRGRLQQSRSNRIIFSLFKKRGPSTTRQNKNNFMLWYCAGRVVHKLHSTLNIHFLIAGHTKFTPDCGVGLIKQAYKRTRVSTLADITKVSLFDLIENRRRKSVICMKTNMLISIMVFLCTCCGKQLF
ncbi:hypothetical protein ATANTOWER_025102, partial [Ataeniobius toweri]|nr:hypothetical protein [Ataeniobius toweri]